MGGLLDYTAAYKIMKKYGINAAPADYVSSAQEAIKFAAGKPIVLKVISKKALHKSKSGVVRLGLSKPEEIKSAYISLKKRAGKLKLKPYKILAQRMSKGGIEVIVGGKTDHQFGKLVLIGLGGIYVEVFKDVALRLCPLRRYDAQAMIDQLKSKSIVAPNPATEKMLCNVLMKVSKMLQNENISELDLNPIIVNNNRYIAVDLRFIMA